MWKLLSAKPKFLYCTTAKLSAVRIKSEWPNNCKMWQQNCFFKILLITIYDLCGSFKYDRISINVWRLIPGWNNMDGHSLIPLTVCLFEREQETKRETERDLSSTCFVCRCVSVCACMRACMLHICVSVCACLCMCMYCTVCVCVCMCMCVRACMCMHMHVSCL